MIRALIFAGQAQDDLDEIFEFIADG